MKNLKILSYSRNGVNGNGFYTATCTEFDRQFLVTFEEYDDERPNEIDRATCRAVALDDLSEKWRGDDFAAKIQKICDLRINRSPNPDVTIYDLIEK